MSLVLILIFSAGLHWLPSSGAYTAGKAADLTDRLRHLVLPLSVVVLSHLWYYAFLMRNRMLEEIRGDYVLLARAKGLRKGRILLNHCLRGALPSYLSIMAIAVPHILGGTYVVETVFSYPGLGTLTYESARYKDYNLLMLLCILSGILVILCSMAAEKINEWLDPRLRVTCGERKAQENCVNEGTVQVSCRHSGGIMPNSSGARLDAAGGIVGAAIGVGDQFQRIISCHNKGAVVGGWTTAVNTTALGGLVGLATGTEITGSISSGDVRSVDATYYIGAAGGAVGFARRDVVLAGDCLIQSRIDAWTPSGKSLLTGLLFGNVVTAATASDLRVAGEISEDGVSAGVGVDNFSGFLADPASNVQPTTSNIVWYEE